MDVKVNYINISINQLYNQKKLIMEFLIGQTAEKHYGNFCILLFLIRVYEMDTVIPFVENCIVLFASSLIVIVILINVYILIRKQFPVKVNCWFCNILTYVAYDQTNSFDCPSCLQYNGFNPDGSYNKYIPEQYESHLNPTIKVNKSPKTNNENGLCNTCNLNQLLKVKQLANFVPLNESNYDAEVEAYQRELEEYYSLCKKCENVLKITLSVQNSWHIGNAIHYVQRVRKSGFKLLDLNKSSHGLSVSHKRKLVIQVIKFTQIVFALFILYNNFFVKAVYSKVNLSKLDIPNYFPSFLLPYFQVADQLWTRVVNIALQTTKKVMLSKEVDAVFDFLPNDLHIIMYNSSSISILGLILEMLGYTIETKLNRKFRDILLWVGLSLVSWFPGHSTYNLYTHVLQHQLSVFVLYCLVFRGIIEKYSKKSPKKIKRRIKSKYDSYEDCTDIDEVDGSLSKDSHSKTSSYVTGRCNTSKLIDLEIKERVLQKLRGNSSCDSIICKLNNSPNSVSNSLNHSTDISLNNSTSSNSESIQQSLDNLHLNSVKKPNCNPLFQRPIISPSRLSYVLTPNPPDYLSMSRSSSNSSGFVSQKNHNFNSLNHNSSLPNSRRNSFSGDAGNLFYKRKNSFSGESDNSSNSELGRINGNHEPSHVRRPYGNLNSYNGFNNVSSPNPFNIRNNYNEFSKSDLLSYVPHNMYSPTSSMYSRYNRLKMNENRFTSAGSSTLYQVPAKAGSTLFTATSPASQGNIVNPIYRKDNTFYPLLNHSNMLYIQANRSPQGNIVTNNVQKEPYVSKLFKMDSILNNKNSAMECEDISDSLTNKFKLN